MRWLGLDYGDKRIGVALSDELGWTAQGLEVIARTTVERDLDRIAQLVQEHDVGEIVLGLPKNMNGTIGPRGDICISFAEIVRERTGLPVRMWDERLSTAAAERTLLEADVSRKKRKLVIDKMAAAIILQNFLESTNMK